MISNVLPLTKVALLTVMWGRTEDRPDNEEQSLQL